MALFAQIVSMIFLGGLGAYLAVGGYWIMRAAVAFDSGPFEKAVAGVMGVLSAACLVGAWWVAPFTLTIN